MIEVLLERWRRRRTLRKRRKFCFHHDLRTSNSYIEHQLIETGKAKMFWCTACQKVWIV